MEEQVCANWYLEKCLALRVGDGNKPEEIAAGDGCRPEVVAMGEALEAICMKVGLTPE